MNSENKPGSVEDLSRLYREIILQHSSQPVGFHKVIKETCRNEQFNPLCGDRIVIRLQVDGKIIRDAAFDGESCAICKASASLLCELIPGELVEEFGRTHDWLQQSLVSNEETDGPQALKALMGVRKYPSRIECVTLPWTAASKALLQKPTST
jgi:nitrogen fixation NifU-like protein